MRGAVETLAPTVGLAPACRALGVARASVYRHRKPLVPEARSSRRPLPCALAPQERTQVLDTLHEDRFVDRAPAAVYATLLEERRYLCSIRTMYRVLHDADEVTERRPQRRHPQREPPRLVATAPKQVWTWDITRLPGPRKWVTYALYVVLDLFSRYVVAWMVATRESATRAQRLVSAACQKQGIVPGQLTLHQDRGAPMYLKPVISTHEIIHYFILLQGGADFPRLETSREEGVPDGLAGSHPDGNPIPPPTITCYQHNLLSGYPGFIFFPHRAKQVRF